MALTRNYGPDSQLAKFGYHGSLHNLSNKQQEIVEQDRLAKKQAKQKKTYRQLSVRIRNMLPSPATILRPDSSGKLAVAAVVKAVVKPGQ